MKCRLVFSILFFSSLLVAQTTTPATVFHSNGAFADLVSFTDGTEILVQVTRGTDSAGNPATFLLYDTFVTTSDGFTDTFSSGIIPDDSFQGGDPAHLSLNVDTSLVSEFSSSSCTFSFTDFSFVCVPGPLGLIQIDWQQDHTFTSHTVSNVQQTFAQFMSQQHTVSDSASATASGSFLGTMIQGSGQAGVNHNSLLQIFKLQ